MWKYCLKKTAQVVIVMILISFFSFAIVYFAPGDISDMYVNPEMTEEQKANVIAQLGLDKSMTEQYFAWAKRAVHGDLGVSLSNKSGCVATVYAASSGNNHTYGKFYDLVTFTCNPAWLMVGI